MDATEDRRFPPAIGVPPLPDARVGLVGFSPTEAAAFARDCVVPVTASAALAAGPPIAVVVVGPRLARSAIAKIASDSQAVGPRVVAVLSARDVALTHDAMRAGICAVVGELTKPSVEHIAAQALRHAMEDARHRRIWITARLSAWVEASFGFGVLTPRQAELIAHSAAGLARAQIAAAMSIRVKRVDVLIGGVLARTGQQQLVDVSRPFAREVDALARAGPAAWLEALANGHARSSTREARLLIA